MLQHVSLVQIDSVNVVSRAHYLPFFSRLGRYSRDALDRWLWDSGEMFEYWAHEASLIPIERRPLLRHRMNQPHPWSRVDELSAEHPGFLARVLEEVARRGPLAASELEDPGAPTGPWWGYGKGKVALEYHFAEGNVTVASRRNFTRIYDVPERVHARSVIDRPDVPREDAIRHLLELGARAHGVGTVEDFADYYRLPIRQAREAMPRLVADGAVDPVAVEGWSRPAFLHRRAARPRRVRARALLAPFDPLVWFRPRAERLFDFRYRIEIYVPAERREFGYYVLPFLLDEALVGRVDLKADRAGSVLIARAAHHEMGVDPDRVAEALAHELHDMAGWLGLGEVAVSDVGNLSRRLRVEVDARGWPEGEAKR